MLDEVILREHGQTDFDQYLVTPGDKDLSIDFYVDDDVLNKLRPLWKGDARKKIAKL